MKIINKTKNTVLAQDTVIADTVFKRLKGLIGRKHFRKGEALIIKPCNSVHTFFMQFPIDVLFVNKHNQIIKAISCLKPWRLTCAYFNSAFVIELPCGTTETASTSKGDIISIE